MKPVLRVASARAPMSSANLSAGFDVLGVALDAFYDEVEVEIGGRGVIVEPKGSIPEENTATVAVGIYLKRVGFNGSVGIRIRKGVPVGRGLGSSGATAAAALFAINAAFGDPLDVQELIDVGARAEGFFSGSPHADNVGPSLLGGFTFIYTREPYRAFSIYRDWGLTLLVPGWAEVEGKTERAREALGEPVSFSTYLSEKYAFNGILKGILFNDHGAFSEAIKVESYHQQVRSRSGLLGRYSEAREELLKWGMGACISGAGPSILVASEGLPRELEERLRGLGYEPIKASVSRGPELIAP